MRRANGGRTPSSSDPYHFNLWRYAPSGRGKGIIAVEDLRISARIVGRMSTCGNAHQRNRFSQLIAQFALQSLEGLMSLRNTNGNGGNLTAVVSNIGSAVFAWKREEVRVSLRYSGDKFWPSACSS
jgi:hypothetical protein